MEGENLLAKSSILDVWQGLEYVSAMNVFVKHDMGTLRNVRRRNMSNNVFNKISFVCLLYA